MIYKGYLHCVNYTGRQLLDVVRNMTFCEIFSLILAIVVNTSLICGNTNALITLMLVLLLCVLAFNIVSLNDEAYSMTMIRPQYTHPFKLCYYSVFDFQLHFFRWCRSARFFSKVCQQNY